MKPGEMIEKGQVWFQGRWTAAKNVMANGCTGVPDFGQTSCCNQHDADYSPGSGVTRFSADIRLMGCIINRAADIANQSSLKAIFFIFVALVFFIGVRLAGWAFYQKEK